MNIISKIADRMVYGNDMEWNMNINSFDWVPGVGLYGIYNAYKATGKDEYLMFMVDWADKHLKEAYVQKTVNSTAPLLAIIELYGITKNEHYLEVCSDIAKWVVTEAPLTREGGLEHTVTEAVEGFSEQIWADTLFMVCIFLAKLGKVTGDSTYTDFAVNQLIIHHKLLSDSKDNLYYHGWNCAEQSHMSSIYWGRANAWIIYSTMEILNTIGSFDGDKQIEDYVIKHINALGKVQRDDGSFGTILNDETSYSEISATSGIVAGIKMAVKKGLVDESYIQICNKGIGIIEKSVEEDGSVHGVSSGTPVMPSAEDYKKIPLCPTLYGQGLAVLALCE